MQTTRSTRALKPKLPNFRATNGDKQNPRIQNAHITSSKTPTPIPSPFRQSNTQQPSAMPQAGTASVKSTRPPKRRCTERPPTTPKKSPTTNKKRKTTFYTKWWPARDIRAENADKYLIEWDGVNPSTNAPWRPSWQPKRNANAALVQAWKRAKAGLVDIEEEEEGVEDGDEGDNEEDGQDQGQDQDVDEDEEHNG